MQIEFDLRLRKLAPAILLVIGQSILQPVTAIFGGIILLGFSIVLNIQTGYRYLSGVTKTKLSNKVTG